jgi:hypothetical protein
VAASPDALDPDDPNQSPDLVPPDRPAGFGHRHGELVGAYTPRLSCRTSSVRSVGVRRSRVLTGRARGGMEGAGGDRQTTPAERPAVRLDPEPVPMVVDVVDDHRSRHPRPLPASTSRCSFQPGNVSGLRSSIRDAESETAQIPFGSKSSVRVDRRFSNPPPRWRTHPAKGR